MHDQKFENHFHALAELGSVGNLPPERVMQVAPSHSKSIFLLRAGVDSALRLAKVFGVSVPVDIFLPYLISGRPSFLVHRWSNA